MRDSNRGLVFIQVFSGMGIGLLVGIIVGLSASEVVSIILGALAALLAAFLGLQDQKSLREGEELPVHTIKMSGLRAGSFGVSCVLAILLGMYLRTHQVLSSSISVKEQVAVWAEAGYDSVQARQYVVYENLGILPEKMEVQDTEANSFQNRAAMGVLFSGNGTLNYCNDLSLQSHGNSVEAVLQAYRATENEALVQLANKVEQNLPFDAQSYLLSEMEHVFCGIRESINAIDLSVDQQYQADLKNSLKAVLGSL